jgi:hypothetical protein
MKGLFVVFVLLVVVGVGVVGLGFYLGWFHFSTSDTDGTPGATITVDPNKIEADKKAAQEKVKELEEKAKDAGEKAKEKIKPATDKGKEETPKP